jgi:U5 small nuclear ribonucleoprotein component
MDSDLYDEFGNYIGPELDSDDDDEVQPAGNEEEEEQKDEMMEQVLRFEFLI